MKLASGALSPTRVLKGLLQHNYLPTQKADATEMPPTFTSISFSEEAARELVKVMGPSGAHHRRDGHDSVEYRLTRFNGATRSCNIPHPAPYAELAILIADNWRLFMHLESNDMSRIRPMDHEDGRLIVMDYEDIAEKTQRTLDLTFGMRFAATTDISSCFPSIYSHAIPWALLGFDRAKEIANGSKSPLTDDEKIADKIDSAVRRLSRNETNGIPIGPATSNIITELILADIDDAVNADHSRFIDDYSAFFPDEEGAQKYLRDLSNALRKYKLNLNSKKTDVRHVASSIQDRWVDELSLVLPKGSTITAASAIRFLSYAADLAVANPESSVIKYAVKSCISRVDPEDERFALFADYLLNLTFHHQHILPAFLAISDAFSTHLQSRQAQLEVIGTRAIEARRSDALTWVLYYLELAGLSPSAEFAAKILETEDTIPITYLSRFSFHRAAVVSFAQAIPAYDYDYDKHWLLRYQLFYRKNLKTTEISVGEKKTFQVLRRHKVSFFADEILAAPKM